jgi:hypothetical protein
MVIVRDTIEHRRSGHMSGPPLMNISLICIPP